MQIKRQSVLLRDVLRSAIESIRPAPNAKHQALDLNDVAANVIVDADPTHLAQAFVNILSASVKQAPDGGVVSIFVESHASEVCILSEDQGGHVDVSEMDQVFELFPHSAEQSASLGLALVKRLIELNDAGSR